MMEKEFIPYSEALALKELGFGKPCLGYWSDWGTQEPFLLTCELGTEKESCSIRRKNFLCSAPTYSQAFRFFREKYSLQHKIWSGKIRTVFYGYDILIIQYQKYLINNSQNGGGDCDYDTYEEAELACLQRLIEIVKSKTR
jgi:hypothetical protein